MSPGDAWFLSGAFCWGVAAGVLIEQRRQRWEAIRSVARQAEDWLAGRARSEFGL